MKSQIVAAPSRLEGTKAEAGGLVSMKKKKKTGDEIDKSSDDGFAKPKSTTSVLGLQELARKRRQEREEAETRKKKRHDSSSSSSSSDEDNDHDRGSPHKKDKHYRSYRPETPSNPGGVSHTAREKIKQRGERDRDKKGIYAESRSSANSSKSSSRRNADDDKYRKSSSKNRDHDSRHHGESSERKDRKHGGGSGRPDSSKRYAEWEETPSSRYSEDDRRTTPRIRYNGMADYFTFKIIISLVLDISSGFFASISLS